MKRICVAEAIASTGGKPSPGKRIKFRFRGVLPPSIHTKTKQVLPHVLPVNRAGCGAERIEPCRARRAGKQQPAHREVFGNLRARSKLRPNRDDKAEMER